MECKAYVPGMADSSLSFNSAAILTFGSAERVAERYWAISDGIWR